MSTIVTLFLGALALFVVGFLKISREENRKKKNWYKEQNELKQAEKQFHDSLDGK